MKSPAISIVLFAFIYVTVLANDYSNGNFEMPSVPSREVLRCMGK